MQQPSVGRIVLVPMDPAKNNGSSVAPAVITRVCDDTCINVPSELYRWTWPPRT